MIKPANRSTLHNDILTQMVTAIRGKQWGPGEKLPGEQSLAKQFHVSRNSIREVLKALVLSGVLEAYPGQGTFLTSDALAKLENGALAATVWGNASLWDLKEVRSLLEGEIVCLAAKRATDEQIAELEKALSLRSPKKNMTEIHANFHKSLSVMAGNPLLAKLLHSVQDKLDELRTHYQSIPQVVMDSRQEHIYILKMIKMRRPEEARQAMIKHIEGAWTDSLYAGLRNKHPVDNG